MFCKLHRFAGHGWIYAGSNFFAFFFHFEDGGGGPAGGGDGRRKKGRRNKKGGADGEGGRNDRKTSLRLGTSGKKSRAAQLSGRRGSLRKRDRTAEKAAKEEAAMERLTVSIPE